MIDMKRCENCKEPCLVYECAHLMLCHRCMSAVENALAEIRLGKRERRKCRTCPDYCDAVSGNHESDMVDDRTHKCRGCQLCLVQDKSGSWYTKALEEANATS